MLALGVSLVAVQPAATAIEDQTRGPVVAHALERIAALENDPESSRTPADLLIINLSRYFARYVMPSSREELSRVLGTGHRMSAQVAAGFLAGLQEGATRAGLTEIPPEFVAEMLAQTLPSESNDFDEVVFFPERPAAGQLLVEAIDLQAFADTGFAWQAMAVVDEARVYADAVPVPLGPAAIDRLHEGVNAYAFLLYRLAGLHAKRELATHVQSRHLREAAKTIIAADATDLALVEIPSAPGGPFTEVTDTAGVSFRHVTSQWLSAYRRYGPIAPSFSGGGISAGDLDGDGWDDLVVCGGEGCAAFRNRRDGSFDDISQQAGLTVPGEARMAVIADFDNDGARDVFITYARDTNRLFRNRGGGRFEDVTADSGLELEGDISGPAIAVDIDGDSLLDIYVGNFGDYLAGETPWRVGPADNGMPNRLYRNSGALRFEEISERAGVANTGWSQAVSHADLDRDGDQDLYVANDFGRNELFRNYGDARFSRAGAATGSDDEFHGMNVAFADLTRDSLPDIFVTNIWSWGMLEQETTEANTLLLSRPEGSGVSYERFTGAAFLSFDTGWSWGAQFFDWDLDGDDDLLVANGFTDYLTFFQNRPHPEVPNEFYPVNNGREPNWLFEQDGPMTFLPVPSALALEGRNSRAIALLDYDRDGDLDVGITTFHSRTRLFRNDAPRDGRHWLVVELEGDPLAGVNRDAIGAQVVATADTGLHVWRSVSAVPAAGARARRGVAGRPRNPLAGRIDPNPRGRGRRSAHPSQAGRERLREGSARVAGAHVRPYSDRPFLSAPRFL
jgi:hypothetical protein